MKKYLAKYDMALMAWYQLGHGDKALVEQDIFTKLAAKYVKTNAQIVLRWHTQVGNVIIPGSKNPAHIKDNLDIFDFRLTDDEMAEIARLDNDTKYYNVPPEQAAQMYLSMAMDFNSQE